ncbi:LEA type 2 family protein [Candidatus Pacearchaeota archaeon]|nr:LEA type 2 family protein [Candidatus Pacearchaeota archaeon]
MKYLFITLIVGVAILGIAVFYLKDVRDISIKKFEVNSIKSDMQYTIQGEITVDNPSKITIPVESVTYDIFLKETEEKISSGEIPSFELKKQQTSIVPFYQEIEWNPNIETAKNLLLEEKTYVIIKGEIKIKKIISITIPFEKEIDLRQYLVDYLNQNIDNELKEIVENKNISEIQEQVNSIIDNL